MSSQFITPKEIIELKSKYPEECLFTIDASNTKKNKNVNFPTYYIPFKVKRLHGPPTRLNFKIVKQLLASSAKIPFGVTLETAKDMRITFREMRNEDLTDTNYPEHLHDNLLKYNQELIEAFNIINDEYRTMVEQQVLTYDGTQFELSANETINSFKQSERKASIEEKKADKALPKNERVIVKGLIPLEIPLFRIKLTADQQSRKIGQNTKNGHKYVVFDTRKTTKKNPKPVVAKVKSKGKMVDLTLDNAKYFITYMSLVGGVIDFDSVCISKSGISLSNKWRDLHVWPHPQMKTKTMEDEEVVEMASFGASGFDDDIDIDDLNQSDNKQDDSDNSDDDLDVPVKQKATKKQTKTTAKSKAKTTTKTTTTKSKARTKVQSDEEEFMDDEPTANDADDDDDEDDADDVNDSKDAEEDNDEDDNEDDNEEEDADEDADEVEEEPPKNKNNIKSKARKPVRK